MHFQYKFLPFSIPIVFIQNMYLILNIFIVVHICMYRDSNFSFKHHDKPVHK